MVIFLSRLFGGYLAKNFVSFFDDIAQPPLMPHNFLFATLVTQPIAFSVMVTYFRQYKVKLMAYLIALIILMFSQVVVHANEFTEPVAVQNNTAETVLQLTPDEQEWLRQHKTIRIAYDGSLPPYSFVNDTGKIDGIAVEIMALLSVRLGLNLNIYPDSNWSGLYKAAARRKVDMVATMVNRPDRAEWFSFTKPYLTKSLVIVTRQDSTAINNRNDLAGKKIAVVKGYQYGEQVGNEFPTAKRVIVGTMLDGLKEVDNGKVDAAIIFLGTANYLQGKYSLENLKVAAFYDRNSANESVAIRKDWPVLAGIIQKGLDSLTEEEVQKIFAKWVVGNVTQPESPPQPAPAPVVEKVQATVEAIPQPPTVEIEQQPATYSVQKPAVIEFSAEAVKIIIMSVVALVVMLLFLLWYMLIRKQNKLPAKSRNEMMTSTRNLQSTVNEAMHVTIEPPAALVEAAAAVKSAGHLPSEYIYYQHDSEGRFNYVSPSVTSLLGYSEADFMANYRNYLTDNPENLRIDDYIDACIQGQPNEPYVIEIYDAEQGVHWLEVMDTPVYDGQGHCIGVDGVMHDITVQKLYDKRSEKLSHQYASTNPAQPQSLLEHVQQAIQEANDSNEPFALIYLALARLRFFDGNVISTHAEVLKEAGKRLRSTLRDTDTVIQMEPDKYALILPATDADKVDMIAEKIRKILQIPYLVGVQSIVLDANIGIAVYPRNGTDSDALIAEAQRLTPSSEAQPENHTSPVDEDAEDGANLQLQLQQELVTALDECKLSLRSSSPHNLKALHRHSQFSVYYQSRHDLQDYNIIGFEALIRWNHPESGLKLPANFVALVKDIGLLDVLTYWIIQQVSFQAVVWEQSGIRPKLLIINLSGLAVKLANEVNRIISIIKEAGAQPGWLAFSIPETEIVRNPDLIIPFINQLVAENVVVAIDNFGSDSSFIPLLKTINAQLVEIDPVFIRRLPSNVDDAEHITNSIAMLHGLGKTVIATEVETERQLDFLKTSGCDMIQGHILSRPLPANEARELLENLPDFAWYFKQK